MTWLIKNRELSLSQSLLGVRSNFSLEPLENPNKMLEGGREDSAIDSHPTQRVVVMLLVASCYTNQGLSEPSDSSKSFT